MEDMGAISFCLGIHMLSCYPTSTPKEGLSQLSNLHNKGDAVNFSDKLLIGSIMYASICTRPDI